MEINLSLTKLIILIIITSLFGYTIFGYLAEISSVVAKILGYITLSGAKLGAVAIKKTGETAEAGVDMIAGKVEKIEGDGYNEETLREKLLKEEKEQQKEKELKKLYLLEKEVDRGLSNSSVGVKKEGYCYVGVTDGVRGCVKVYKDESCMSGNIYPTQEICMNPDLRL
jgi:hypothetical protein